MVDSREVPYAQTPRATQAHAHQLHLHREIRTTRRGEVGMCATSSRRRWGAMAAHVAHHRSPCLLRVENDRRTSAPASVILLASMPSTQRSSPRSLPACMSLCKQKAPQRELRRRIFSHRISVGGAILGRSVHARLGSACPVAAEVVRWQCRGLRGVGSRCFSKTSPAPKAEKGGEGTIILGLTSN